MNIDIAIFEQENAIRLGVIIRDDSGDVVAARSQRVEGINDVQQAELMVAVEGLKLASEVAAQEVILEGDSRLGIESIESSIQIFSYSGSLIHEISRLGLRLSRFKAQYVPKNFNRIADSLAHLAKFVGSKVWFGDIPNCIKDLVNLEI